VYFAVAGVTGSVLVFRPEFELGLVINLRPPPVASSAGPLQTAWNNLRRQYPQEAIAAFAMNQYPGRRPGDPYRARVLSPGRTRFVYVDSSTGQVLGSQHPVVVWLQDLHFNLFAGRNGAIVNGAGGVLFVVMCVTGAVIWWPGRRHWRRGLTVRRTARWPLVIYDLHSLVGIASVALLAAVAATGVYLVVQDLDGPDPAQLTWQSNVDGLSIALDTVVQRATSAAPDGVWVGLSMPSGPHKPFRFDLLTGRTLTRVFLDPGSAEIVRIDRAPAPSFWTSLDQAIGDLHYGRVLGLLNRSLWLVLGVVPSGLLLTGVLMWWNRTGARWTRRLVSAA